MVAEVPEVTSAAVVVAEIVEDELEVSDCNGVEVGTVLEDTESGVEVGKTVDALAVEVEVRLEDCKVVWVDEAATVLDGAGCAILAEVDKGPTSEDVAADVEEDKASVELAEKESGSVDDWSEEVEIADSEAVVDVGDELATWADDQSANAKTRPTIIIRPQIILTSDKLFLIY